jgi:hypothetical protein
MRALIVSSAAIAAVLIAATPSALAQARQDQALQNRFCLQIGTEGQARCAYRTLAQCEHARARESTGRCFDRTYMIAATPPADAAPAPRRPTKHAKPSW